MQLRAIRERRRRIAGDCDSEHDVLVKLAEQDEAAARVDTGERMRAGGKYAAARPSAEVTIALRACHTGTNHVAGSASAARRCASSLRQCAARSRYGPASTLGWERGSAMRAIVSAPFRTRSLERAHRAGATTQVDTISQVLTVAMSAADRVQVSVARQQLQQKPRVLE